ncbi:MAG: signal peptidase I [Candidatus Aenigmarchaeota archaeon]|nr:signal peptidase I [Candidatus Aenigmarchaeota archaeon]
MIDALKKVSDTWNKYTQGTAGIIIYVVVGFLVAYLVNTGMGMAFDTDTPMVAVFSQSMVPTFYKGDLVFVTGSDDYSTGDIIVFDVGNKNYPIIHRVFSIEDDGSFRTKGDNNGFSDPWIVSKENIHGKASFKIPYLGWVKVLFIELLQ